MNRLRFMLRLARGDLAGFRRSVADLFGDAAAYPEAAAEQIRLTLLDYQHEHQEESRRVQ